MLDFKKRPVQWSRRRKGKSGKCVHDESLNQAPPGAGFSFPLFQEVMKGKTLFDTEAIEPNKGLYFLIEPSSAQSAILPSRRAPGPPRSFSQKNPPSVIPPAVSDSSFRRAGSNQHDFEKFHAGRRAARLGFPLLSEAFRLDRPGLSSRGEQGQQVLAIPDVYGVCYCPE